MSVYGGVGGAGFASQPPLFIGAKVVNASAAEEQDYTTEADITWDTENADTQGFHSTSSNSERLTIPAQYAAHTLIVGFHWVLSSKTADLYTRGRIRHYDSGDNQKAVVSETQEDGSTFASATMTNLFTASEVAAGDYFVASLEVQTDTDVDLGTNSHFFLEVVGR